MRILRIVYDWPQPWTGLSPNPFEYTKAQKSLGHEIDVICGRWPRSKMERIDDVNFYPIMREPLPHTMVFTSAIMAFFTYISYRKRNETDVIHAHGHFGYWIFMYRAFLMKYFPKSKELKTPLVVHFHNTVKGRAEKMKKNGVEAKKLSKNLNWPVEEKSDRLAIEIADACVFPSQNTLEEAKEHYGADESKCYVIENGVNTRLFVPVGIEERHKSRRDLGLEDDDRVLINIGAQVERKGIHKLIEMMKYIPPHYKLLLVGPTSDKDYEIRIETDINLHGVRDKIIRVEYTPYPRLPIAYQISDLFVLPSSFEGLPKVALEALATGVPVLASGFRFTDDIQGMFYINSTEAEPFANQISQIVESHTQVDRTYILSNFSWEEKAKQLNYVYSKAFEKRRNA